ncbi:MAG: ATP-binding protein [Oscillospiraceae bacterium]
MALDGKLLARARQRLAETKEKNAALHEARTAEVYAALPAVKEIDGQLRALFSRVLSLTLAGGGDPAAELAKVEEESQALCAEKAEILVSRGYAPDYLEDIADCPKCRDTGYTPDGKMCSCLAALYEEEKAKELSSLTALSRDSFAGFDLNYYQGKDRKTMEMNFRLCVRYAEDFGPGSPNLLFRGGTGLGKTLLSSCIARVVSEKGFSVVYESAADAFAAFEEQKFSRGGADGEAAGERVRRILSCDLFVLDDLGTEMTTPYTQSALYQILNSRLNRGKATIISTNLGPKELEKRYTPQICSRLMGEYDILFFVGEDIRAIKKQTKYT